MTGLADLPICERCGQPVAGSHWHCGGCDSTAVTGMYGHHTTVHIVGGKFVRVSESMHHCVPGDCSLDTKKATDGR